MDENDKKQEKTPISEKLFESLMAFYTPATIAAEADETKSTAELIEEMDQIQDSISPQEINNLMEAHGFKLQYTGMGYAWLLKTR